MPLITFIRILLRSFWKATLFLSIIFLGLSALAGWASFSLVSGIIGFLLGIIGLFDDASIQSKLIKQIRSQVPDEAKSAISQLNSEGYLHRNRRFLRVGVLRGKNFTSVNLSNADLRATDKNLNILTTNLEHANFTRANLSGANLTKVNLRNAILDHTDLENAILIDAQLENAHFTGTNLRGADLTNANLQGAIFVNVICDEKTILPNGDKWISKLNWAMFRVSNETPDFISKQATQQHNIDPLSEKRRESDLQLLQRLWAFIKSQDIRNIVDAVSYRNLKNEYVRKTVEEYIFLRENPENKFIDEELETRFQRFDESLEKFLNQLSISATVDSQGTYIPTYKQDKLFTSEQYDHFLAEHNKTKEMGEIAVKYHREIVAFLKKEFPEFNFMR